MHHSLDEDADNNDMIFAYLLHLAHLVDLQYTLFLPAGIVLKKKAKQESQLPSTEENESDEQDYAFQAMTWYQQEMKHFKLKHIAIPTYRAAKI